MKKYLIIFIATFFCYSSTLTAQENKLNYSWGNFSVNESDKVHWKSADHLFEHDQELLDKYLAFRRAKKSANGLGIACLAQAITGAGLIFIPGGGCEWICEHQAIGIVLLVLTAPVTGLVGIVVAASASARKSKLIYLYDRQDLSEIKSLKNERSELKLTINGLGLGLSYSF